MEEGEAIMGPPFLPLTPTFTGASSLPGSLRPSLGGGGGG